MFHGIVPSGETPGDPAHINLDTFNAIVSLAKELGFETITSEELLGFLSFNDAIPPRAMILILDDRRPGTAEQYFLPINKELDWTTTLAWPIGDTDSRTGLWMQIEAVYNTGYFDIQSHGLQHNVYLPSLSAEETREEIRGSIPILEEHFGQTPIAYIWPGGIFNELGIQVASESGFELGFTVYSRGPIQFNWIPQGEEELEYGAPLLTLPRFWSSAALLNLQQTAALGDEARLFARENYLTEAAWYQENCGAELAPLSDIFKSN
jgi:peptidoglycan/xylan/chitin deacetylase (PgdA/CDA1 family)